MPAGWAPSARLGSLPKETRAAREAGDPDGVVLWYGQDAGLINAIEPAGEVVARVVREAHEILNQRLPSLFASA
jgi:NAD(P)H-dependent flavin oxidoreductase YrpB (nitropropane dioxygenase family)